MAAAAAISQTAAAAAAPPHPEVLARCDGSAAAILQARLEIIRTRFLQTTAQELRDREAAAATATKTEQLAEEGTAERPDGPEAGMQADRLIHVVARCCSLAGAVTVAYGELKDLAANADTLARELFDELLKHKRWPCPAKREAYIFAQLCCALLATVAAGPSGELLLTKGTPTSRSSATASVAGAEPDAVAVGAVAASQAIDRAHLVGAPAELTAEFAAAIRPWADEEWAAALSAETAACSVMRAKGSDSMASRARVALAALLQQRRQQVLERQPPPDPHPSKMSPPRMVLRVPGLEAQQFTDSFYRKGRAVIVPGAAAGWDAARKWPDLAWLYRQHGYRLVPVEIGVHGRGAWEERVMSLGSFITDHLLVPPGKSPPTPEAAVAVAGESADTHSHAGGEHRGREVAYLAQHALFTQIPSLQADFAVPAHLWGRLPGARMTSCNAWFGTPGTVSPLHIDADDNFLAQLAGHKYVRLYGREQTENMYVHAGASSTAEGRNSTYSQGNISRVTDVEAPDAAMFPLFAGCRRYKECVLGPGDMLFIPAGMWHYVRALAPPLLAAAATAHSPAQAAGTAAAAAETEGVPMDGGAAAVGFSMSINFFFRTPTTGCY